MIDEISAAWQIDFINSNKFLKYILYFKKTVVQLYFRIKIYVIDEISVVLQTDFMNNNK